MSIVDTPLAVRTRLFIGGQFRDTDDHLEVRDPANPATVVGVAAAATTQDALDAVSAFPS